MPPEQLTPRGVWRLDEGPAGARLVIPTRPVWFVPLFLIAWLCGWAAGESFALRALFQDNPLPVKAFLLVWVTAWTAGGVVTMGALVFSMGLAREVLFRDGADFCARWEVFGLGWTRRWAVSRMGPLVVPPAPPPAPSAPGAGGMLSIAGEASPLRPLSSGRQSGSLWKAGELTWGLSFQHGSNRVVIGKGLDAGQAAALADVLVSRFGLKRG